MEQPLFWGRGSLLHTGPTPLDSHPHSQRSLCSCSSAILAVPHPDLETCLLLSPHSHPLGSHAHLGQPTLLPQEPTPSLSPNSSSILRSSAPSPPIAQRIPTP